jgi:hypothetical protein
MTAPLANTLAQLLRLLAKIAAQGTWQIKQGRRSAIDALLAPIRTAKETAAAADVLITFQAVKLVLWVLLLSTIARVQRTSSFCKGQRVKLVSVSLALMACHAKEAWVPQPLHPAT